MSLSDFLKFESLRKENGTSALLSACTRPSTVRWLVVPRDNSGLAYVFHNNNLQCLQNDKTLFETPVAGVVVAMAAARDGRMVAVCCHDETKGDAAALTVHCFDVTTKSGFATRYLLNNLQRNVQSMSFGADHALAIVDDAGLHIVSCNGTSSTVLVDVTSAVYSPSGGHMAVGTSQGIIQLYDAAASDWSAPLSTWDFPTAEPPCPCTHLDWLALDLVAAGYCRVTPGDAPRDEGDEGDTAEHEALMVLYDIQPVDFAVLQFHDLGDVVPFFSVPKGGSHLYFTSYLKEKQLLLVASNLSSDVKVAVKEGGDWQIVDVAEGSDIQCPTNEDDEFTYPTGLGMVINDGMPQVLLMNTDGSLNVFKMSHEQDSEYFELPIMESMLPETAFGSSPAPATSSPVRAFGLSSTSQDAKLSFGGEAPTTPPFGQGAVDSGRQSSGTGTSVSAATFGCGSATPLFGSGAEAPSFGISFASTGNGFNIGGGIGATAKATDAPFNIFQKAVASPTATMAKPLFGTPVAETPSVSNAVVDTSVAVVKETSVVDPMSAKAAGVFDSFDKEMSGSLPVLMMEDLIDALGEGFCGDEMEVQVALVDTTGCGKLERSSFIEWYRNLANNSGKKKKDEGDNESLDSDEQAERDEEAENARKAFMVMSSGEVTVASDQFEALFESLGSTYCEEEHGKAQLSLNKDGCIHLNDFVNWYLAYLFDDDPDNYDDEDSVSNGDAIAATDQNTGWGDIFKADPNSWKCVSCMVTNSEQDEKCAACQAPRPGYEGKVADICDTNAVSTTLGSSIGAQGFTFGGGQTAGATVTGVAVSSSTFSVNFGTSSAIQPSGAAAGGFTFGSSQVAPSGGVLFEVSTSSGESLPADELNLAELTRGPEEKASFSLASTDSSKATISGVSTTSKTSSDQPTIPISSLPTSGVYPPMTSAAPKPFSFDTGAAEKSKPSASAGAYPPMTSAAPKPFSFDTGAAEKPPMTSAAPKPFSFDTGAAEKSKPSASAGAYPPMTSAAPKPFSFDTGAAEKPHVLVSTTLTIPIPKLVGDNSSRPKPLPSTSIDSKSPKPFGFAVGSSFSHTVDQSGITRAETSNSDHHVVRPDLFENECTRQYAVACTKMTQALASLVYGSSFNQFDAENEGVAKITKAVNDLVLSCQELSESVQSLKDQLAFVAGKSTDSNRRMSECRLVLDKLNAIDVLEDDEFIQTQPLDAESERLKRRLISFAMLVDGYIRIFQKRLELLKEFSGKRGESAFLLSVANLHGEITAFKNEVTRSTSLLEGCTGKLLRDKLEQRDPQGTFLSPVKQLALPPANMTQRWMDGESLIQEIAVPDIKFMRCHDQRNLLVSKVSNSQSEKQLVPQRATTSFSSPPVRARAEWDLSTVDQNKAFQSTFTPPKQLRQTSFNEDGGSALAPFGTTPTAVQEAIEVARRGVTNPGTAKPNVNVVAQSRSEIETAPSPTFASTTRDTKQQTQGLQTSISRKLSRDEANGTGEFGSDGAAETNQNSEPSVIGSAFTIGNTFSSNESSKAPNVGSTLSFGNSFTETMRTMSTSAASGDSRSTVRDASSSSPNYAALLTSFYETHNPSKVAEVPVTLQKYKDREAELFDKLSRKYGVASPLQTVLNTPEEHSFGAGITQAPSFGTSSSPQRSWATAFTSSPFEKPPSAPTTFGSTSTTLSPFTSGVASSPSPPVFSVSSPASNIIGGSSSGTAATPLLGQATARPISSSSPFPSQPTNSFSVPLFGSSPVTPGNKATSSANAFAGKDARVLLTTFYQEKNPTKLADVDKLLTKYQGNHELMFRNLAKKYALDPSVFGLPAEASTPGQFGGTGGFGQPSPLGGAPVFGSPSASTFGQSGFSQTSSAPGFGNESGFGQSSSSGFGQSSSSGFGQTSTPGATHFGSTSTAASGFGLVGSPTPGGGFGPSTGGFGSSFGAAAGSSGFGGSSFGSLANSSQSAFGSSSAGASFGSPFGGSSGGPCTPFGAPRR